MKQLFLKITGRVQGVFFRSETQDKALELGLKGWVRNTSDGGVEVLAQGPKENLHKLIDWCRKGPDRADVNNIAIEWQTPQKPFTNFTIAS